MDSFGSFHVNVTFSKLMKWQVTLFHYTPYMISKSNEEKDMMDKMMVYKIGWTKKWMEMMDKKMTGKKRIDDLHR